MIDVKAKPENAEYFIGQCALHCPETALALARIIDDLKLEIKRLKKKQRG